ncbi:MAG: trimeric intracellular cation channel family protein, partial [Mesorhizobium sp.]
MNPIELLDYAGVAVFAATGALAASRKQLDIIGYLFLASVAGIGGGTFRDVILNVPVFWVGNRDYVLICAAVAVLVFFSAHRVESRYKLLLWLDAIGLAAFSVMGAAKGPAITGSSAVSIVTGMLTAT